MAQAVARDAVDEPSHELQTARRVATKSDFEAYIIVGESTAHQWVVKDSRATLGAVFRDADVALRFAHRQARALGCGVVVVRAGAVNLDCLRLAQYGPRAAMAAMVALRSLMRMA